MGAPEHTPHILRYTYASLALEPITNVSRILGHATPAITLQVYSHFLSQGLEETARTMAGVLP